ncbi:FecCD family ABC transporter permease [Arthrobacter glacialis]|uniref:Enterobactin ABC transporter permease n=1 Tax=Arthrobacter glacialis TaxID=1664 RepID=A0A2S4A0V0_ARTGL|nr:iron chelate uptake ABC transporter family permease subunit [Arthrobacter glacialis]POH75058.1 enterobactin ABC transporter permease [Arthrobacter glacialis]
MSVLQQQTTGAWVRQQRKAPRRRKTILTASLSLLVFALLAVNIVLGSYTVTIPDFLAMLGGKTIPGASFIVMENKFPQAVLGLLVGASFGVAGAIFQSMLRNPLASPDIIGISYGASATAVAAVVIFGVRGAGVSVAAIVGALAVAMLITALARGRGGSGLILIGIGAAAFMQSAVTFLLSRADINNAQEIMVWLTGSLNSATWERVAILAVALLLVLPFAAAGSRELHGLALGDDTASGLGFNVPRARLLLTIVGVLLAAFPTAAAGPIAFVAFLSGPIAKRLNGGAASMPLSALVGAAIVLAANFVGVNAIPGVSLPVGVVTGALGAPFLLWLLISSNRANQGG